MVRSPAASRKRRIDSSSAELEEQPATSPRKSKLRKVSVPSPESSVQDEDAEGAEEEEQPALEAGSAGSTSASLEGNEEDAEEDAEYQEKYKIWEMFADEYHDSECGLLLRCCSLAAVTWAPAASAYCQ